MFHGRSSATFCWGGGLTPSPRLNRHCVADCDTRSAVTFGQRRSSLRELNLRGFGDQWISYSAVVAFLWLRPSTWRLSTSSSLTRSLRYVHLPTTRRRQHTLTLQLGRHCVSSRHFPSTTSLVACVNFLTKVPPRILYRRSC